MIAAMLKLGVYGGAGFIAGLAVLGWIRPETPGGRGLLLLIMVLAGIILGRLLEFLFRKPKPPAKPPPQT
jgi:hypothetical protein